MLTGVHFLLTYKCTHECDHCFVFSGPRATGTFTGEQIRDVLDECVKLGTVETVFFEGGEPFLYYPLLLRGLELAAERGFKTGVVTNAYWATSEKDAELWLAPLARLGVATLSVSDDAFHFGDEEDNGAKRAVRAAEKLGLQAGSICIEPARVLPEEERERGAPIVEGGPVLRGRAAEKLSDGLPRSPCSDFIECPFEDLRDPGRVHVDALGNVHLCQGLSMGNLWETPFAELVESYDPDAHPIAGPLLRGGPAALAADFDFDVGGEYVDACHACYSLRKLLRPRLPSFLAPPVVYDAP
jgi:MoaA/NifB/PqqE/SkfB family radical SAM enzyme